MEFQHRSISIRKVCSHDMSSINWDKYGVDRDIIVIFYHSRWAVESILPFVSLLGIYHYQWTVNIGNNISWQQQNSMTMICGPWVARKERLICREVLNPLVDGIVCHCCLLSIYWLIYPHLEAVESVFWTADTGLKSVVQYITIIYLWFILRAHYQDGN